LGQHNNTGRGASLQEEIDFGDDIHQETDVRIQFADEYGGVFQGLSPDHRQAIKVWVVSRLVSQCRSYAVMSLSGVISDYFPTFIFMKLINVSMRNFSFVSFNDTS